MQTSSYIALSAAVILILIHLKLTNFRAFLLTMAFLVGLGADCAILQFWGFDQVPVGVTLFLPILAVVATWLIHLAIGNLRHGLIALGIIVAAVVVFLLFYKAILVICGAFLVWIMVGTPGTEGEDYLRAEAIHSIVPEVSVGEAYWAEKSGLM